MARENRTGGIILAGGLSRRMGSDKAQLSLKPGGKTLLELVIEPVKSVVLPEDLIIVANKMPVFSQEAQLFTVVADNFPGKGPLAGLEAGLNRTKQAYNFLLACDMPFLQVSLLRGMVARAGEDAEERWDALVPLNRSGLPEPLCALYHRRVLPVVRNCLSNNVLKMGEFLSSIATRFMEPGEIEQLDPSFSSFENLNTGIELAEAARRV